MTITAVAYCRAARDPDGTGVERQAAACREFAARSGLEPPEILSDGAVSAYSRNRPGYAELLTGLRARRWGAVVVTDVARITRDARELDEFVRVLRESGTTLHAVDSGVIDVGAAGMAGLHLAASFPRKLSRPSGARPGRA